MSNELTANLYGLKNSKLLKTVKNPELLMQSVYITIDGRPYFFQNIKIETTHQSSENNFLKDVFCAKNSNI